ncbi:hypothetical protein C8Q80DRAFT_1221354 [Daedaleopsis nitida]|nr:hypothetical protein C8Q80DRAFT_1221354 [Daedaleopsis nitida]
MASEATPHSTAPHTPGTEHPDPNSSSSTLEPASPVSPFSASFDPNGPTPPVQQHALALRDSPLYPITEVRLPSGSATGMGVDASQLWAHRLSASFGAIADQIAAASKALATVPESAVGPSVSRVRPVLREREGAGVESADTDIAALAARLDIIEREQERLGADVQEVQTQVARMQAGAGSGGHARSEKEHGDVTVVEVQEEGVGEFKSAAEMAIEELQKRVEGAINTIKLDQARLYSRLLNATVTTNKMKIQAPMMANGKTPQNFPSTKGEFEHLTKERYEYLLNSYDLSVKGNTNAKREALREFIGLTPPN